MIENSEHFVWGSAIDQQPQYGLYNAVTDCFMLVTPNLNEANQLKSILSSRYELLLVELSSADNFNLNLIDNTVCTNWSFEGKHQIKIGTLEIYLTETLIQADTLCASTQSGSWPLESEQNYALMCQHWINFLNQQKHLVASQKFDKFLPLPDSLRDDDDFFKLTQKMYRTMYLGQNLQLVDQDIKTLIEHSKSLFFNYQPKQKI